MLRRKFTRYSTSVLAVWFSGCSLNNQTTTPGTLVLNNEDDFPHILSASVVDGPSTSPAVKKERTAKSSIEPHTRKEYKRFITSPGDHKIEISIDGSVRNTFVYNLDGVENVNEGGAIYIIAKNGGSLSWNINY